jgi:manganese oxidase
MTWSPSRPGNWLFHCHFALHLEPDAPSAASGDLNMRGMGGLVLGAIVADQPGARAAGEPTSQRHLRLIAVEDSAAANEQGPIVVPSMHFVLEERGHEIDAGRDFSPELDLTRGEPVAITVVNHLREPTSVHWHGIEVEDSYMDGAAGFGGSGAHVAPAIAPGDSFEARFTPPRSGTFMYHAHVDEQRQDMAGLVGALIVRDPGTARSDDDHVFFLKSSRLDHGLATPVEINGRLNPDTVVFHAGRPARLRLINLSTHYITSGAKIRLAVVPEGQPAGRGAMVAVQWLPIAKDGADLPVTARAPRPAQQIVAMGETYDFEYTPARPGRLRLEVLSRAGGALLLAVPIRVE